MRRERPYPEEHPARRHQPGHDPGRQSPGRSQRRMLTVTVDTIAGYEIVAVTGEVLGTTARPRNPFLEGVRRLPKKHVPQAHAPDRNVPKERVRQRSELLRSWRQEAIARMTAVAYQRGANAVVGMHFDHRDVSATWTEICAYGTGVFIVPAATRPAPARPAHVHPPHAHPGRTMPSSDTTTDDESSDLQ